MAAIEYIRGLQRAHEQARNENARLRPEAENYHVAQAENERLRSELAATWTALRRADPAHPHVYGQMTGQLAQQQAAPPAATNNLLPPIQQQQPPHAQPQSSQWGAPAPAPMQGVEYGGMRPYEHSHR
jgi:hypothetical protein